MTLGEFTTDGGSVGMWSSAYRLLVFTAALQMTRITTFDSGCVHEAGTPECLSPRTVLTGIPAAQRRLVSCFRSFDLSLMVCNFKRRLS